MAEAPIMPLATDAYLADTNHLDATEHGAYLLLIITLWRAGGRLPNDPAKLAKYARLTPQQFKRVWPVIEDFFLIDGDQIGQAKCDDMLSAVRAKSKSASESARAKWRKNKKSKGANASANASGPQCENDAIQDPVSSIQEDTASAASSPAAAAPEAERPSGSFLDRLRQAANAPETGDWLADPLLSMHVERWKALGLTEDEILTVAASKARGRRIGSPSYLDGPMQDFAGKKLAPPLRPTTPEARGSPAFGGGGKDPAVELIKRRLGVIT